MISSLNLISANLIINGEYLFKYVKNENEAIELALKHFVDSSKIIKNAPNFKNSKMFQIDEMVNNLEDFAKKQSNYNMMLNVVSPKTFIALAAPSLVGKTQLAFVLAKKRPLYFALGQYISQSYICAPQDVYLNFESLNFAIQELALLDIGKICAHNKVPLNRGSKKELNRDFKEITAESLTDNHQDTNFFVLGLLLKIVQDAAATYDSYSKIERPDWMKFYSDRGEMDSLIKPVSLNILKSKYLNLFKNYCVFLDEFSEAFWSVFIRNIVRALGLRCIVANTNTDIANLVMKSHSSMSGSKGRYTWSVVVTDLDPLVIEMLTENSHFDENVEYISDTLCVSERRKFKAFCEDFKSNQIKFLRAGISIMFVENIKNLKEHFEKIKNFESVSESELELNFESENENDIEIEIENENEFGTVHNISTFSLLNCFNFIFERISVGILRRKFHIASTIDGEIANLALLSSASFRNDFFKENMFNIKTFLKFHLYFIINPVDRNLWFFFLECPESSDDHLQIYLGVKLTSWIELSYFKAQEEIALLACIFSSTRRPVSTLLLIDNLKKLGHAKLVDLPNPTAESNSGNHLEIVASMSIIDASHFYQESTVLYSFSFGGVSFIEFFKNLLRNLIQDEKFKYRARFHKTEVIIEFPSDRLQYPLINRKMNPTSRNNKNKNDHNSNADNSSQIYLTDLLNQFHVPFLHPSNLSWPKKYQSLFPLTDPECSLKLGTYYRTANIQKIDGNFQLIQKFKNSYGNDKKKAKVNDKIVQGIVECKNLNDPLDSEELRSILRKALNHLNSKFCFIFCKLAGGYFHADVKKEHTQIKELIKFLIDNSINLYRVIGNSISLDLAKFRVVPFRNDVPLWPNPKLICFILEIGVINSDLLI